MKPSEMTNDQLTDLVEGPPYDLLNSVHLEYEDTGLGKFEGNVNPGLTERLYTASLDTSWLDEETGTVDGPCGWAGRIGRFAPYDAVTHASL